MSTLVVVAQRARARLFLQHEPRGALTEVADLVHPTARLRESDLKSDRPGRVHERVGEVRHAMGQHESPQEHEAATFAREIADAVRASRERGDHDRLVLVAEPRFLGELRQHLDRVSARALVGEVHRELTDRSAQDIAGYLAELPTR
ncbi:MAG: host attachment protein [Sandaracinaceae bacterium]